MIGIWLWGIESCSLLHLITMIMMKCSHLMLGCDKKGISHSRTWDMIMLYKGFVSYDMWYKLMLRKTLRYFKKGILS